MSFEKNLRKYAELIVEVGVNLQEKQGLYVSTNTECLDLARLVLEFAYKKGASHVEMNITDDDMVISRYQNARDFVFESTPKWKIDSMEQIYKDDYAVLFLNGSNPDLLASVDPSIIAKDFATMSKAREKIMNYTMKDLNKWCVAAVATKAWAKNVFEDLDEEKALEKLWDNIFYATRVSTENPIKEWEKHVKEIKSRSQKLNKIQFKKLHYKSNGTDLIVEMPDNHIFMGASTNHKLGEFIPNIPTEEIFSAPHYKKINGKLSSTRALSLRGTMVDGIKLEFKDGKVVDFSAEKGYETLKKLFETDDGAMRLGEIALVPDDSPISNTNVFFNNTLYDENASCHFAFGKAYPTCVEKGGEMSVEELEKAGLNHSLVHVDFMVGSKDLEIVGYDKDEKEYKIFEKGNWAGEFI